MQELLENYSEQGRKSHSPNFLSSGLLLGVNFVTSPMEVSLDSKLATSMEAWMSLSSQLTMPKETRSSQSEREWSFRHQGCSEGDF